jgi:dUTP pyrophosphatase
MNVNSQSKDSSAAIMAALAGMGDNVYGRDVAALKYKRLTVAAYAPRYATDGSGCFDLMASEAGEVGAHTHGEVGTSLAFEIPTGHVMLVFSRSGHGFKNGVRLTNCVGVIDSDYRGEVRISLRNDSPLRFDIKAGDRIAQAMLVPIPYVALVEVDELSDTNRGVGGFGSTGN